MSDLSAVREVWASRSSARSRTDLLYLVYVAALSVLVLGVPALNSAGQLLSRPDVLPVLSASRAPQMVAALTLAAAALAVLVGAVRGPALMAPFFIATLASSGLRRRDVLRRPFARALLVPVLGLAVLAALIGSTLVSAGRAEMNTVVLFVVAAVGAGLLLGTAWLVGQLLRPVHARLACSASLLMAAAAAAAAPVGLGAGGAYPVGSAAPLPWALGLLGGGLLAAALSMVLLDQLQGAVLREQAARWESAATHATTGDLAGASGQFRPPPSTGRRWPAVGRRPLVLLYARRDAVAWMRSPERLTAGILAGLASTALLAASTQLSGPLAWGSVLVGSAMLWGASSAPVDGIRHGIHTLGAPPLLGQTAGPQVLLHTPAPAALLGLLAVLGGGTGLLLAGGAAAPGPVLLPALLAVVLIAGRARDAAKGPMPLSLMTPMPTAQGDLSVISVLLWQADGLLLALAAGAALALLTPLGAGAMLLGAGALLGAMALMTRSRLRALRG